MGLRKGCEGDDLRDLLRVEIRRRVEHSLSSRDLALKTLVQVWSWYKYFRSFLSSEFREWFRRGWGLEKLDGECVS